MMPALYLQADMGTSALEGQVYRQESEKKNHQLFATVSVTYFLLLSVSQTVALLCLFHSYNGNNNTIYFSYSALRSKR